LLLTAAAALYLSITKEEERRNETHQQRDNGKEIE
jgi:hypothetical protein